MATYTNGVKEIESIVSEFLFSYKLSTDDFAIYVNHACLCFQDFNLYDGNIAVSQKFTLDTTLKWIDLPDDFVAFIDLVTPNRGQWWSFTEKDRIINTTTFDGAVEGRDADQGEGELIDQPRVTSYGAKGGYNKFKYTLDMQSRRIYIDDDITDYIVLFYVSSGIQATGETNIPIFLIPMIHSYLLWKSSYWLPERLRERDSLERDIS